MKGIGLHACHEVILLVYARVFVWDVAGLVRALLGSKDVQKKARGRVLCLHGFKTSAAVLQQQMAPAAAILDTLGYELVVPNGPHKTTGFVLRSFAVANY